MTHTLSSDSEPVGASTDLNLDGGLGLDGLLDLDVLASSAVVPPELVDVVASNELISPVQDDSDGLVNNFLGGLEGGHLGGAS